MITKITKGLGTNDGIIAGLVMAILLLSVVVITEVYAQPGVTAPGIRQKTQQQNLLLVVLSQCRQT
jgi:hypothetical protein